MSKQNTIPCLFMRGGTSRGPFFDRRDLPDDLDDLAKVLVSVVGAGHKLNIDGIGGGVAVTTKVVMISPSDDEWADIDYFFAQVNVEDEGVDFGPSCGNMLSGVAPAALEMGMMPFSQGDTTTVKIAAVNTGAKVEAIVQTPSNPEPYVEYEGDIEIAGVPRSAAPIMLNFRDVVGSKTGALFPSGKTIDIIDGIDTTLIDIAVPMMIVRAADLGKTGHEQWEALTNDSSFMARLEALRLEAGKLMGLGDVSGKVIPKVGLLAPPQSQGCVTIRYFMPWQCHPSLAVTGSMGFAGCVLAPGTVAEGVAKITGVPDSLVFEHPQGQMEVTVDYEINQGELKFHAAGSVRTARLLMKGDVIVPSHLGSRKQDS